MEHDVVSTVSGRNTGRETIGEEGVPWSTHTPIHYDTLSPFPVSLGLYICRRFFVIINSIQGQSHTGRMFYYIQNDFEPQEICRQELQRK